MRNLVMGLTLLLSSTTLAQSPVPPAYEVLAIRYGTLPDFPVSGLIKGAEASRGDDEVHQGSGPNRMTMES
jgi:hypothetical protein